MLKFRHRIGILVALAALALVAVATVTYVLGRRNVDALAGIEDRYVPLIELDRDLKTTFAKIPRALEDAASAAEDTKLLEADALERELLARLHDGSATIVDNGGDPAALQTELESYYRLAREVSVSIMAGAPMAELAPKVEQMRRAQLAFATHLDAATTPDRARLAAAFASSRETQTTSLSIDIAVASVALLLMTVLSWRIIRRTVTSLQAVSAGVERLARGEFAQEIAVTPGDELGDLAREANRTAGRLRAYRERSDREDWIKTGVANLADQIVGEHDPTALARKACDQLAAYTGAKSATIDPDAGHTGAELRVDGRRIIAPLLHEREVMGVLELDMPDVPTERVLDLVARSRNVLGTGFRVAKARERERALLVETQRQATAAQVANKELEAFSYSVSHDLRAPLRGIDGFSQALLEDYPDALPAKGQDYLRRIRAAAQRMAELIDDMLRLARVSRADFKRERVDLSALVSTVVAELRKLEPRTVEVRVQPDVIANADPRLIRITLENLLGNAWKFTSKTTDPVIEFGARDDGFFVRDNGAGFDMKYADRLFGAFQRLHTDKEFPGTGIGLATVQRIIHRHGGRVWVEAEVGKGATFHFTLPVEHEGVS